MSRGRTGEPSLTAVARAGFQDLSSARSALISLAGVSGKSLAQLLEYFADSADADSALLRIQELSALQTVAVPQFSHHQWQRLALLFGASPALGSFFVRQPASLNSLLINGGCLRSRDEYVAALLDRVNSAANIDTATTELRIRYRELLAEIMLYDLVQGKANDPTDSYESVALALSELADAALHSALELARKQLREDSTAADESAIRLAIIAMGKCGARELNVVSDVDVMFIAESTVTDGKQVIDGERVIRLGTKLAKTTMSVLHDSGTEPPLWQVDANLRPEGKQGALVRSLSSMRNYYDRWAKTWEFQALLKARAAAGDIVLGESFVNATRELVWSSASREDFVGSVQRMRERVTENIDPSSIDTQLKLGPGGLRDIEFSVQLLQLVHGQAHRKLRIAATIPALQALVKGGFIAREDGDRLSTAYRQLRVLEHRLQLRDLRRTANIPKDESGLRFLARASGLAATGEDIWQLWRSISKEVRELHLKIFYAPLLNAVAELPGDALVLESDDTFARLRSIGFVDVQGALQHLKALTKGSSRNARIQRNLLPVLLKWLADGTDPDYGLLAFRKVSEANRDANWYLRLLRDGNEAAERLMRVLSCSRLAADMLETDPDAVAWLEHDEQLKATPFTAIREQMLALAKRREDLDDAAGAMRAVHRREVLRLILGRLVYVLDDAQVADGLDAVHTALLEALLLAFQDANELQQAPELALIAMGRFGGQELGFASDLDLLAVYRPGAGPVPGEAANVYANKIFSELRRLVSDPRFAVDLDFDLRPEGKSGPLVRSLDAYRAYYERWSLTWEAQALLRARFIAGDESLGRDFEKIADQVRYPPNFDESDVREVRRIKARVETERLPRGVDPKRHLKLGPGGISDVEWLVQLVQLQHGYEHVSLRTTSTLSALKNATELGILTKKQRKILTAAWSIAASIRSASKLWSGKTTDVLPTNRRELAGIAGVMGMDVESPNALEEQWLAASRRARAVFEAEFFGYTDENPYTP